MRKEKFIKVEKINAKIALNTLTFSRVIGGILMLPIYFTYGALTASITAGILTITDFIDGKVARGLKIQTMLGSILDSISDKCLGIICLLILSLNNPAFMFPIAMELGISAINYIAYKNEITNKSRELGRLKAWPLGIGIFLGLLSLDVPGLQAFLSTIGVNIPSLSSLTNYLNNSILATIKNVPINTIQNYIIKTIVAFQALALADYTINVIKEKKIKKQEQFLEYERKPIPTIAHDLLDTNFYLENKDKPLKLVLMRKKVK